MDSGIIHGDIKPENVLIFKKHPDAPDAVNFTAKIIDFGYSTRYEDDDEYILMPRSRPWNAPEHCFKCKPVEARKMDLYSFGMLCLWVMFEKHLSNPSTLPWRARKVQRYLNQYRGRQRKRGEDPRKEFLADLEVATQLRIFTRQVILGENVLNSKHQQALVYFFSETLVDVSQRAPDLNQAFGGFIRRR
jgi:serine/threonine protein kinase